MSDFPILGIADADLSKFISSFAAGSLSLSSFATAAAGATAAAAAIAVVGLIPAVDAAIEFQREMVKIINLSDIAEDQMERFSNQILDLAPSLGASPAELARSLYAITSGGLRTSEAIDLMTASAKASKVGLGDMAAIGRIATGMLMAYKDAGLTAAQAIDIMLVTAREGNLEAEELATAFGRVTGVAAMMGVSLADVGAFIATFSRLGVNAEISATSLRAALFALMVPGAEARDTFEKIGLPLEELRRIIKDEGLAAAFIELMEAATSTTGSVDILGDIIPNIRGIAGVMGTAGVQAKAYLDITNKVRDSAGENERAFDRYSQTAQFSFDRLGSAFKTLGVNVGSYFLPATTLVVEYLAKLTVEANKAAIAMGNAAVSVGDFLVRMWNGETSGGPDLEASRRKFEEMRVEIEKMSNLELGMAHAAAETRIAMLEEVKQSGRYGEGGVENWVNNLERVTTQYRMLSTEIIRRGGLVPGEIEGINVVVGATDEQVAATERMIDALDEELMKLQGRERELIISQLVEQQATGAQIARTLAIYDAIRALKAQKELEEEMATNRKANERYMEQATRRIRDEATRGMVADWDRKRKEDSDAARLAMEFEIETITMAMEKQERYAEMMASSFSDAMARMIISTKDFGDAFRMMVANILADIARMRIEEAIIGPLLKMFIRIPGTPGAIPTPVHDPTYGGTVSLPSTVGSGITMMSAPSTSGAVIIQQNITFAPNMIDARSGRQFLQQHAGDMADIVGKGAQQSSALARKLRGGR